MGVGVSYERGTLVERGHAHSDIFAGAGTGNDLFSWVGHRPGQARLWMGVGAIVAFAPITGSVSSDEYKDRL